ncbi:MAG: ribosome silencing factor [Sphingomonadales bacterium]|nr:ribosome silencing factor [Sphingomonadales bacterium]
MRSVSAFSSAPHERRSADAARIARSIAVSSAPPHSIQGVQPILTSHRIAQPVPAPAALHALILASLDDDQAQEVVSIPLAGKSEIADAMVIASGRSTRQVAAIAQKLAERIKQAGFGPARIEGLPAADWVVIDAGDVVVHVFRPEVRSFYNLERMWGLGEESGIA